MKITDTIAQAYAIIDTHRLQGFCPSWYTLTTSVIDPVRHREDGQVFTLDVADEDRVIRKKTQAIKSIRRAFHRSPPGVKVSGDIQYVERRSPRYSGTDHGVLVHHQTFSVDHLETDVYGLEECLLYTDSAFDDPVYSPIFHANARLIERMKRVYNHEYFHTSGLLIVRYDDDGKVVPVRLS